MSRTSHEWNHTVCTILVLNFFSFGPSPGSYHRSPKTSFLMCAERHSGMEALQLVWHSIVGGHLGCFQFLSVMRKIAVNIDVKVSEWHKSSSLWDKCQGGQMLHKTCGLSCFKKLPNSFPEWPYHSAFLSALCERSSFSTPAPVLEVVTIFLWWPFW